MHLDFNKNLGNSDRLIRVVIGVILVALAVSRMITGWWAVAAVVMALFQFMEAALAY